MLALCGQRGCGVAGVGQRTIDLKDAAGLAGAVREFRPDTVVHAAAMTAVGDCFARPNEAEACNVEATRVLADAAAGCGARLVYVSTDMVFDGAAAPYRETDAPRPLSVYGATKLRAEQAALMTNAAGGRAAVVRLPLMYGRPLTDRPSTFVQQIDALRAGRPLRLFRDEYRTAIALCDAAAAVVAIARSDFAGVLHAAGPQRLSRLDLIVACARALGLSTSTIEAVSRLSAQAAEPRPEDLSLDASRFLALLPHAAPGPIRRESIGM